MSFFLPSNVHRNVCQVYAVLPAAAMFMVGYNWLSNHVGSRALFHLTITPFFVFYAVFAFVMYPMRGVLHHPAGGNVSVLLFSFFCTSCLRLCVRVCLSVRLPSASLVSSRYLQSPQPNSIERIEPSRRIPLRLIETSHKKNKRMYFACHDKMPTLK